MSGPTAREIADLMARLRELSDPGRSVDADERAVFFADKHELLDRIAAADRGPAGGGPPMVPDSVDDPHALPAHGNRPGYAYEPDSARREQLARWHADDQAATGSTDAQEWASDADGR